ncbi:MAG: hypothetical protein JWQ43_2782, partial [Glaciihabitans sp.]|nr:hypothetical protein [Glaciihabitans sp.]
ENLADRAGVTGNSIISREPQCLRLLSDSPLSCHHPRDSDPDSHVVADNRRTVSTRIPPEGPTLKSPRLFAVALAGGAGLVVASLVLGFVATRGDSNPGPKSGGNGEDTALESVWTPLYSEDFDDDAALGQFGAVYGDEWNGYNGFTDTSGRGSYDPDRVLSVADSVLDFHLRSENGVPLVAAPLPNGYTSSTYGRYSIRLKTEEVPGYKIAFLLWPESDVWNDGEIDYPEGNLDGDPFYGASIIVGSHAAGVDGEETKNPFEWTNVEWDTAKPEAPTNAAEWHTATLEWTPGLVEYFWDGVSIGHTESPDGVPSTPMRWTLQAETNLDGEPVPLDSDGHLSVDWVRAWSYTPDTDATVAE